MTDKRKRKFALKPTATDKSKKLKAEPVGLLDLPNEILVGFKSSPNDSDTRTVVSYLDNRSVLNLSLVNKAIYCRIEFVLRKLAEKYYTNKAFTLFAHNNHNLHSDNLADFFDVAFKDRDVDMWRAINSPRMPKELRKKFNWPKQLMDETNTYDFGDVVAAIESSDNNLEEVLAKMRTDLDEIVRILGFPFHALIDAIRIDDQKYDQWNPLQRSLFSVKVIGYLQRLACLWLKKALAAGIANNLSGNTLLLKSGESIDPALDIPNQGLGFLFCVDRNGKSSQLSWRSYLSAFNIPGVGIEAIQNLLNDRQKINDEFYSQISEDQEEFGRERFRR